MNTTDNPSNPAGPAGAVLLLLRLEGLVELAAAVAAYRSLGGGWLMFAALFLVPDVSMFGYLANRRVGAAAYNLVHTYATPAALALLGFLAASPLLTLFAAISVAHIGFDRTLGYGLKYPTAFGATHLLSKGV